jgi:uncharacterized protein YjbI with pentapeptide repeats
MRQLRTHKGGNMGPKKNIDNAPENGATQPSAPNAQVQPPSQLETKEISAGREATGLAMRKPSPQEIDSILEEHSRWLADTKDAYHYKKADFSNMNLGGTKFSGWALKWANFNGACLEGARFRDTDMYMAKFEKANLQGAKFHDACLEDANMAEANLAGAVFIDTDLSTVNLEGADLRKTRFLRTNVSVSNFTGADLRGADMRGAIDICDADFTEAIVDKGTKFPADFEIPDDVVWAE